MRVLPAISSPFLSSTHTLARPQSCQRILGRLAETPLHTHNVIITTRIMSPESWSAETSLRQTQKYFQSSLIFIVSAWRCLIKWLYLDHYCGRIMAAQWWHPPPPHHTACLPRPGLRTEQNFVSRRNRAKSSPRVLRFLNCANFGIFYLFHPKYHQLFKIHNQNNNTTNITSTFVC